MGESFVTLGSGVRVAVPSFLCCWVIDIINEWNPLGPKERGTSFMTL